MSKKSRNELEEKQRSPPGMEPKNQRSSPHMEPNMGRLRLDRDRSMIRSAFQRTLAFKLTKKNARKKEKKEKNAKVTVQ